MTTDNPDIIRVTMFGEFKIESGNKVIGDTAARTHQLWHLIEYMLAFRDRTISPNELIEALWPDNDIDNPSNALKNLIYRVRSAFETQNFPHARNMVTFDRGCYQWNNSLNTYIDVEEFEELYRQVSEPGISQNEKIKKCMAAIDLYTGDFLPGSRFENWVVPISSYYRSMYLKFVYTVLDLLFEKQRYEEAETICQKALVIDQFEENTHKYLLMALVRQGKRSQAMAHYNFVTDLFFRELGVTPSASMRDLYHEVIKTVHDVELDINVIEEDLRELDQSYGAFYCEYEVFKNLYRLEARTAVRSGQSMFISLLTVTTTQEGDALDVKTQSKAMDTLFEIVKTSLRRGDVFSRFSASQYVLLLPTLTYENCEMVLSRIVKRFKQGYRSKAVEVVARTQPLAPIERI